MKKEEREAIRELEAYRLNNSNFDEETAQAIDIVLNLAKRLQREKNIKDGYIMLVSNILYDYDGYFNRETNEGSAKDLADLIDETCDYLKKAILNDDKSVIITTAKGKKCNILHEHILEEENKEEE